MKTPLSGGLSETKRFHVLKIRLSRCPDCQEPQSPVRASQSSCPVSWEDFLWDV